MNCDEAREWLMDAEPEALATVEGSPVAAHLETCTECRAVVARLRVMQRELRDAYSAAASLSGAEHVAFRAMAAGRSPVEGRTAARRRRWVVAVTGVLGLAAAAVLAVSVVPRHEAPRPARSPEVLQSDSDAGAIAGAGRSVTTGVAAGGPGDALARTGNATSGVSVDVPEGRNAIVFATRNPLISVVWIY